MSDKSNANSRGKRAYVDLNRDFGFKNVTVSLCNKTADQRHVELKEEIDHSHEWTRERVQRLTALSSVLDELVANICLPLQDAFEHFAGKVPSIAIKQDKKESRRHFKDTILSKNGLPVIVLNNGGHMFVMLLDLPLNNSTLCRSLDLVLDRQIDKENADERFQTELAPHIPFLMKLMSSSKDRAILTFVLSSIFSSTRLALTLGLQNQRTEKLKHSVQEFLREMENEEERSVIEAERHLEALISKLETDIASCEREIETKKDRLHDDEVESRNHGIATKRARLERLQGKSKKDVKKRMSRRIFHKWKQNILSQRGKGKGRFRIDRRAEQAVYQVLQEQLKAHRRRWGDEGTGYLEHEQRIQSKEMLRIANRCLKKIGKTEIKSKETVRSWGRCRNKRYRQSQQHRGQNLWANLRPQKKHQQRHINVHYNRAHIKNYTRFAFGKSSVVHGKRLVIRRAIDDKAYVRCGTSEGFSRPLHTPFQLNTGPDSHFQLPSADYPDPVGYVSPGVILMVNDMEEVDHNGKDKIVPTDVTVSVTCKPKNIYPSSATNWANDLFANRYIFQNEHEMSLESESETVVSELSLLDHSLPYLIAMRDSVFQFELMTIQEDFKRVSEGGDYLSRELLRVQILQKRLEVGLLAVDQFRQQTTLGKIVESLSSLLEELKNLESKLVDCQEDLQSDFESIRKLCHDIRTELEAIGIPRHRPIDIQTSDAGPGVSSHEHMTQIRMAEYFMVNYLDLQCRFHYAPNDSSCHIVEKVMRSLNECLGDGRAIPVPCTSVVDNEGKFKLAELSNDDLKRMQTEQESKISKDCASEIKNRFNGKPCMGTSIHAMTPWYGDHQKFFFDEKYMAKCAGASSPAMLETCAGKGYYKFVREFFNEHYFVFDNGFEGIRNGCKTRNGNSCQFHGSIENSEVLHDGWSGVEVKRIQAPVPNYSCEDEFHYAHPADISSGNITEKFGLESSKVVDAALRERDDFCPRKKLDELVASCGNPELKLNYSETSDTAGSSHATVVDSNDTLVKMLASVDEFVKRYTGEDLRNVVEKEIKRRHDAKIKAFLAKKTHASAKAMEKAKTYKDFNWDMLIKENKLETLYVSQLDLYLMANLGHSKKDCEKKGFTKLEKIEEIRKHFYSSVDPSRQHTPGQTIHFSVPHSRQSKDTQPVLHVPPWGGTVMRPHQGPLKLVNTCPIDNFLTIFYVLMKTRNKFCQYLARSPELYASKLLTISQLFDKGNFAEGKCEWLKLFPGQFNLSSISQLDLWGNEEERFVSRLYSSLETKFTSTCSSPNCPSGLKQICSKAVTLSNPGIPPPRFLQESLTQWMETDLQTNKCGERMHTVPPGASHFLGSCFVQDPVSGQLLETIQSYCGGQRTNSRRVFQRGAKCFPPFLLMSMDIFARDGILTECSQLSDCVEILHERYHLFGLTFWSGGHYRGAVLVNGVWHHYDGLWERNTRGQGLQKCTGKPSTPRGFLLSHCVYIYGKLLQ